MIHTLDQLHADYILKLLEIQVQVLSLQKVFWFWMGLVFSIPILHKAMSTTAYAHNRSFH